MSNITDRLLSDLNYHYQFGLKPTRLYLGYSEYRELESLAKQFGMIPDPAGKKRLKWNGLDVFQVMEESHFGLNTDAPSPCG